MTAPGSPEHRARLQPILELLQIPGQSVFLDLCEMVLMVAERIDGSLEWDHPRVVVYIRQKRSAEKIRKRRVEG